MSSHALPDGFLTTLAHQRFIVDYVQVAAFALLFWDYLLTLHLEIRLVWFSKWNLTKVLFLLTRYLAMANVYFMAHIQLSVNPDRCSQGLAFTAFIGISELAFAETLLSIRTWAVWFRDMRVIFTLGSMVIANVVTTIVSDIRWLSSLTVGDQPYRGHRGCIYIALRSIDHVPSFISLVVLDATVLVLMIISGCREFQGGHRKGLTYVIHRDGILFYIYILCISLSNLIILVKLPGDLQTLLFPFQACIHSVLPLRVILNIRLASMRKKKKTLTEGDDSWAAGALPMHIISAATLQHEEVPS